MNPFYWNYQKALLIGGSGCGKTKLVLDEYLPTANNLMIIDTNMEISSLTGLKNTTDLREWSPSCPCIYPKKYNVQYLDKMVQRVRCFTNVLFFLDDIDTYSGGQYFNGIEIISLMINARHQNIGVIICNKTPNNIDKRVVQNSHFVHLWNINSRYKDVLEDWSQSLGIGQKEISEQMNLETHTFGYYVPVQENPNATDPKKLLGYFRL